MEENKYYKGCYVPEEDFLKYCKDVKRKSYYGFKSEEVKIILPNDTVVSPEEYWKSKEKKKGRWKPKMGEKYYLVDDAGDICSNSWGNYDLDAFRHSIGNCFKTYEEAEEYKTKLVFQQQYRDYALEHNDEIDWENDKQKKWYVFYEPGLKGYTTGCEYETSFSQGTVYFTNEQDIWDFIKLIGKKEFKKYILEVEE